MFVCEHLAAISCNSKVTIMQNKKGGQLTKKMAEECRRIKKIAAGKQNN